jgi:hypothetical protein
MHFGRTFSRNVYIPYENRNGSILLDKRLNYMAKQKKKVGLIKYFDI